MFYMIGWVEDLNFFNYLLVVLNSIDRLINKGLRFKLLEKKYLNMILWYFIGRLCIVYLF